MTLGRVYDLISILYWKTKNKDNTVPVTQLPDEDSQLVSKTYDMIVDTISSAVTQRDLKRNKEKKYISKYINKLCQHKFSSESGERYVFSKKVILKYFPELPDTIYITNLTRKETIIRVFENIEQLKTFRAWFFKSNKLRTTQK